MAQNSQRGIFLDCQATVLTGARQYCLWCKPDCSDGHELCNWRKLGKPCFHGLLMAGRSCPVGRYGAL